MDSLFTFPRLLRGQGKGDRGSTQLPNGEYLSLDSLPKTIALSSYANEDRG